MGARISEDAAKASQMVAPNGTLGKVTVTQWIVGLSQWIVGLAITCSKLKIKKFRFGSTRSSSRSN